MISRNSKVIRFFFCCWPSLALVIWLRFGDLFVYQNPNLIFLDGFWVVHIPFVRMVKFKLLAQFTVHHLPHYYYYYCLLLESFSHQFLLMVLHWSLSDSKSPQVSRTLPTILAVLNNAVVWLVSTRHTISKSFSPFNNPLLIVPKAPIMIGITVTFKFHIFFNSLARSRYLSFFPLYFSFILWSVGTAKSTILHVLFFYWLL